MRGEDQPPAAGGEDLSSGVAGLSLDGDAGSAAAAAAAAAGGGRSSSSSDGDDNHNDRRAAATTSSSLRWADCAVVSMDIVLTPYEERVFDLLRDVCERFDLKTTMRVAGGWVRDKCLGGHPHDIDIALDDMKGAAFAEKVNALLVERGEETHRVGVIGENPEQSKHLETATVNVLGGWLDFVHLRTEEYAAGSRIPTHVGIGTPDEDARRRDLTINTLFYNLNTRKIEDFTGQGIPDLKEGILRTPLAPLTTFLDDPLRVLRTVRFAARLRGARIHADTAAAAQHDDVRHALGTKVSRERVGKELIGCFAKKADPVQAMRNIHRLHLFAVVFTLPPDSPSPPRSHLRALELFAHTERLFSASDGVAARILRARPDAAAGAAAAGDATAAPAAAAAAAGAAAAGAGESEEGMQGEMDEAEPEDAAIARCTMVAALMLPWAHLKYRTRKKRNEPVVRYVIEHSVKWPSKDAAAITTICSAAAALRKLVRDADAWRAGRPLLPANADEGVEEDSGAAAAAGGAGAGAGAGAGDEPLTRLAFRRHVGVALRAVGESWRMALLVALADELPSLGLDMRDPAAPLPDSLGGSVEDVGTVAAASAAPAAAPAEAGAGVDEAEQPDESGALPLRVRREYARVVARFEAFVRLVDEDLDLGGVLDLRPLVNGREVGELLDRSPGPWLQPTLSALIAWQLERPEATRDEAIAFLETIAKDHPAPARKNGGRKANNNAKKN